MDRDRNLRFICFLVVVTCLVAPVHSFANHANDGIPPITQTLAFSVDHELVGNCGSFHIIADGEGTIRETIYFNDGGDPSRVNVQARYRGTLTNSVTGAAVADEPSVIQIFVDFERMRETHVGQFFNINVPGKGTVALEVGRYVVDASGNISFIHGQFDVSDSGLGVLCAALD
ncbi:MAG TPA: hypothetical protein VJM12_03295 [Pyrinomonadaceae bacterium]|nr:hypothetical protein [Pyrinomonadaceae bacterium]